MYNNWLLRYFQKPVFNVTTILPPASPGNLPLGGVRVASRQIFAGGNLVESISSDQFEKMLAIKEITMGVRINPRMI